MKTLLRPGALLAGIALLLFATLLFAQDGETAPRVTDKTENAGAQEARSSSSQEVEINEDTYRQFMELKDANRQGDIIPETAFKPGSGLQKLDKLPEESQKHLRNELREIIVQGDPWQPGDENADYPYTPSAAASQDPTLQKQEMEAWGELVDSYNQREAQIYADRAGNRATPNPQDGQGDRPGTGADKTGKDGEDEAGVPGQPSARQVDPDRDDTAGSFSPDAVHDSNTQSASGVSQNALEFLQGPGGAGENEAGGQAGTPQDGGQKGSAGAQGQAQTGQQDVARQTSQAADTAQSSATGTDAGSAGAAQNALEFLHKEQARAQAGASVGDNAGASAAQTQGRQMETAAKSVSVPVPDDGIMPSANEPEEESTAGATQNALEFLKGETQQDADAAHGATETGQAPAGTLTIQDLLNAQGLGGAAGTDPAGAASGMDAPPDESSTDKDGGGR